ncbi:MAG: DEAD/DEAH box helicase [Actinomycetota bacterium]
MRWIASLSQGTLRFDRYRSNTAGHATTGGAVTFLAEPDSAAATQLRLDAGHDCELFDPARLNGVELRRDLVPGVGFHPAVARWFERRFDAGPTPPQVEGWPHIHAGRHTLIAAPTGSGKTLAGFLMSINRLYVAHAACEPVGGTQVVYVSPLKALAVDIAENLERPLIEIAAVAAEMGLTAPDLTIGVRTGDTPSSERQAMLRRPRTFMVTTPESLYLLVTAAKSRATLSSVRTLIVDEIHAMARDKRGCHLALTMERLDHVTRRPPIRIGLSATQRPVETVARLLVGTRVDDEGAIDCAIVDGGHQRALDLHLELPDGELEAVASHAQMDHVLDRIAELVADHHTTLVFVNTRSLAERLAHQLGERLGDDVVSAHHGSLSKARRHRVERRLRAGELKALVATASLELGIDVGPVELVCQIGSPRSIATFLQRVGRSNHTRHGTPRGRLYPLTRDELIECTALLRAVRAGRLDALDPPVGPLDILAQQVVAETGAEEWTVDGLYDLLRRAEPYRDLTREAFAEVITLVSDGIMTGRGRRAAWVHHDAVNGELRGRKGARYVALSSGGAIGEIYDMRVVVEPDELFIGTVTEDWATESAAGDIFLLGTHSWRIRQVTGGEVRVTDAEGMPPTVPFWTGEAPARTVELSEEVSAIRAEVDEFLDAGHPAEATAWLRAEAGIETDAAALIVAYLATAKAVLGGLPTATELVMERFFDDADGMQLVIHSPLGGRINRAMGYALRKKFCVGFNFELQAAASDDAVVISLGPHHSFPLGDVQHFLRPDNIREALTQAVLDQPAFQTRWRWNLNRALVVLRMRNGRRNPPPIQRMESDDLLAALFPDAAACQENVSGPAEIPDHPLVRQTLHDTLTEGMDVDGLIDLWARLGEGAVTMRCVDTTEPSALAHEILTARPYAFLDDDAEVAERRTRAVPLRRGLPLDPSSLGTLLPEAIAEVRAELAPNPTTADELHDLLRDVMVVRARAAWAPLMAELDARGRGLRLHPSTDAAWPDAAAVGELGPGLGEWWAAAESAEAVEVLRTGQPNGELFPEAVAATVLRGHLELHSPVTAEELGAITGLGSTVLRVGLATVEAEGSALQGRFTSPDGTGPTQWASRRLLARMHGRSRQTRRRRVEPATPEQFVRFLTRWHHVAPGTRFRTEAGLDRVLEQLQGWPAALAAWEPDLLASRIDGYQAGWLDRRCHDGQVQWLRLSPPESADAARPRGSGPSKATPVSLVNRADLGWLLPVFRGDRQPPVPDTGAVAEVVAALSEHGPRFLTELAADTARLPTDVEQALWHAVARGLVTADGFDAVRNLVNGVSTRAARQERAVSKLRRAGVRAALGAGRWSLVTPLGSCEIDDSGAGARAVDQRDQIDDIDMDDEVVEALADQLLQRWGVLFYSLVAHEKPAVPWRRLQWALRRFEDRGLVRGGRFVKGFSGEQFALPEAAEALDRVRRDGEPRGQIVVSGSDPLNLTGVILPGPRVPARRTERVELPT